MERGGERETGGRCLWLANRLFQRGGGSAINIGDECYYYTKGKVYSQSILHFGLHESEDRSPRNAASPLHYNSSGGE